VVLECCPGSNVALGLYPSFDAHPFPSLLAAGCKATLNSDDPPYFQTSLGREYAIAREYFALGDKQLTALTRTAIEAAFLDKKSKADLLERLPAQRR
jgi:adenosine deaminase